MIYTQKYYIKYNYNMVKLNGTRGKHRKTKMHKNKSKQI